MKWTIVLGLALISLPLSGHANVPDIQYPDQNANQEPYWPGAWEFEGPLDLPALRQLDALAAGKDESAEKDAGAVQVTFDRLKRSVRLFATPGLQMEVGQWRGEVRLCSDGTEIKMKAQQVVVTRLEAIIKDYEPIVHVNVTKDGTVTVTCDKKVRLVLQNSK